MNSEVDPRTQLMAIDPDDEDQKVYEIKHPDLKLLDEVSEKMLFSLLNDKKLRPYDRKEAHEVLGAIQGVGDKGEAFQGKTEQEQNSLLSDMYYSHSLAEMNNKFMVTMDYKPAAPSAPAGPQIGFAPLGPGMGGGMGGMRPQAPAPTPPGGFPPSYMPPQQGYPPYPPQGYPPQGYPQQPGYPPIDPQTGQPYPPYPPQGYPPQQGNPYGQGYAQPHPYPSYPAQPGYPPIDPATGQPYPYPPQGYPQQPPPAWPPQQPNPVIVEADVAKDTADPADDSQ